MDWRSPFNDPYALAAAYYRDSDFIRCRGCSVPDEFDSFAQLCDAYHPTGTLRMGSSPSARVVDAVLRLGMFGNCYNSSTSVFLSVGTAHSKLIPGVDFSSHRAHFGCLL